MHSIVFAGATKHLSGISRKLIFLLESPAADYDLPNTMGRAVYQTYSHWSNVSIWPLLVARGKKKMHRLLPNLRSAPLLALSERFCTLKKISVLVACSAVFTITVLYGLSPGCNAKPAFGSSDMSSLKMAMHLSSIGTQDEKIRQIASAINQASEKYKLPKGLLFAIMQQESRGDVNAKRFEASVAARLPENADRDNLATSHGLMQVMGYQVAFCGLNSWRDLYDPQKNIDCASKILRQNLSRLAPREALITYNGKGKKAEAYALLVVDRWRQLESIQ